MSLNLSFWSGFLSLNPLCFLHVIPSTLFPLRYFHYVIPITLFPLRYSHLVLPTIPPVHNIHSIPKYILNCNTLITLHYITPTKLHTITNISYCCTLYPLHYTHSALATTVMFTRPPLSLRGELEPPCPHV